MVEMRRGLISSATAILTASPTTNAPLSAGATASTWQPSPKADGRICSTAAVRQVFLRVLDDRTLGFADFRGNRQYISVGNLSVDDRAALFLMDYANRARLKILGHIELKDLKDDPDLAAKLAVPGYKAKVERAMLIHLQNFDWNCPQHITPRFTQAELEPALGPIRKRLIDLQQENENLKAQLAKYERPAPTS
jgi:predicted pyridoxine 5'-phosphate oxidase superfamily flavin-nucleotide-binding protein